MEESRRKHYRERLRQLRARLMGQVSQAAETIAEKVRAPGNISSLPTHSADHDTEGLEEEITLATTQRDMLDSVDAALQRIEQGSFGHCEQCGQEIAKVRLDAIPFARLCARCARRAEGRPG